MVTVLLLVASACPGMPEDAPIADRQLVEAVITAHEANRAAMPFGTARFRYTTASATDADAAHEGELNHPWIAEGLYVFEGSIARYERVYPLDVMLDDRVETSENEWTSTITSTRCLTDGTLTLWDDLVPMKGPDQEWFIHHSTQISEGAEIFYRELTFPLELNAPGPSSFIRKLRSALEGDDDRRIAEVDDRAQLDGFDVIKLTVEAPTFRQEYWIDLERGAIPRKMRSTDLGDGSISDTRYDDLRRVADRAWLPFRESKFYAGVIARQLEIVEADFSKPPDRSLFQLAFDRPRSMVNAATKVKYAPQATWSLLDLPARSSSRTKILHDAPTGPGSVAPPEMPTVRDPTPWWRSPAAILVAVLLAIGLVVSRTVLRGRRNA